MLRAGRGRLLVEPQGLTEGTYETASGIVVTRPKPVRKSRDGKLEHAPVMQGRVLDVGPPDAHSSGGAPELAEGDLVLYYEQRAADVFYEGTPYHVILGIDVLGFDAA